MTSCAAFSLSGPSGVADALQKLDCAAAEATGYAFGRLFGANGSFQTALTILLTLYVALFAFGLLTGRSSLRVSALTPRMMTLGLVLTFVTSWVAYQSVVWNLAVGAPDEIATALTGSGASATLTFASRLDSVFDAIGAAAQAAPGPAVNPGTLASPASILSIAGFILLLGTIGVLAVCRLALAALLILGPVFIVLALFEGTRGLFEGWLKSVALFAFVPLLTVLLGSGALYAIEPMVQELGAGGSELALHSAVTILLASIIYVALMLTAVMVAGTLTRSWRTRRSENHSQRETAGASIASGISSGRAVPAPVTAAADRVRTTVASVEASSAQILSQRSSAVTRVNFGGDRIGPLVTQKPSSHRVDYRSRATAAAPLQLRELLR